MQLPIKFRECDWYHGVVRFKYVEWLANWGPFKLGSQYTYITVDLKAGQLAAYAYNGALLKRVEFEITPKWKEI